MQYKGIEYQTFYERQGKMYKTIGYADNFNDADKNNRIVIFTILNGYGHAYYMPEAQFEKEFNKVNQYT